MLRIVTEYDSTVHEWGQPEDQMQALLEGAGIEIAEFDAGTSLMDGQRDVQIGVEAPLEKVLPVLETANVNGIMWQLEVGED